VKYEEIIWIEDGIIRGAFSFKEKAGKKKFAIIFNEIFQGPLQPKKLAVLFSCQTKRTKKEPTESEKY